MDMLNSYSRRAALLHQRKQAVNNNTTATSTANTNAVANGVSGGTINYHNPASGTSVTTLHTLGNSGYQQPAPSNTLPSSANGGGGSTGDQSKQLIMFFQHT